jgi:archaellum biogenesis protein FlaJ (TadC family)
MGARSVWAWWLVSGREADTWAWDDRLAAEKGQPVAELAARRRIRFCRATALVCVVAVFLTINLASADLVAIPIFIVLAGVPIALVGYLAGAVVIDVAEKLGGWFSGRSAR